MQPNFEKPGGPNLHNNQKIYLSNFDLLNKHVEYSDQHVGARHSIWFDKDFKFMKIKICTIILTGMRVLALKVLALFTLGGGALIFESLIFIYGWMPAHGALVMGALIGAIIYSWKR